MLNIVTNLLILLYYNSMVLMVLIQNLKRARDDNGALYVAARGYTAGPACGSGSLFSLERGMAFTSGGFGGSARGGRGRDGRDGHG